MAFHRDGKALDLLARDVKNVCELSSRFGANCSAAAVLRTF